jgi:tetratricopeptide (TPR) repeat protein
MQLTKMPGVLVLIAVAYAMTGEGVSWGVDASTRPARVAAEAEVLATQLSGPDPTRQVEAVGKVRKLLETEPNKAVGELRGRWLKAMMAGGRYDDAAELALKGILIQPQSTQGVPALQEFRVRALLAAGKKQEALSNAKSLFNVAPMDRTADAMLLVAECVRAADPELADRFREEEIAGAATQPVGAGPTTKVSVVLAGIKVDARPYEEAIGRQTQEEYYSFVGLGNLLLLADKPREARAAFERAYAVAAERDLPAATGNIAKAMKAEDGTIGRANGWILSLRPGE